jgi:hypothetical protein
MTHEQQKIVDGFHERVIQLIFKRRRAAKYGCNSQKEWDDITKEIEAVENERRKYERDIKSSGQKESTEPRGVSETAAGNEQPAAKADI